ncbi:hypothetical protein [Pseudonocardia pini]|uniref:hypothetical protein n=1 Tax=Pseudonocardia pini TaxID=2758030 RepID=UPI001C687DE2|nr:hypothetical protein [Pseudonocardia pini]
MRIASLLPAATEIVSALGLRESLAARTFECPAPGVPVVVDTAIPTGLDPRQIDDWVGERARAGLPMYELDRAALRELDPDLILTQDLCRVSPPPRWRLGRDTPTSRISPARSRPSPASPPRP